ncbi:MAG: surface antigen [Segetibacter sp.]|nr:surface antigen [Segetibacter sp.]
MKKWVCSILIIISIKSMGYSQFQPSIPDVGRHQGYENLLANFDSVTVQVHPAYDSVSKFHRFIFGENYRKEWAVPTKLPVIKVSEIRGGLTPVKAGGGHQSRSIRLTDKTGKEWTLRSVEKYPEVLLPENLRETFAKDWLKDAMSAQHPYSALIVPVIANAVKVPYSNPVIGVVAPDESLGTFSSTFVNTVCLLEEREPWGKSDNTLEMLEELNSDNDNSFDSTLFLKARLLDLFIGDWDRHDDQWRWVDARKGKGKHYIAVPRDRDQVFHIMEGAIPSIASLPWGIPYLHDFDGKIKKVNAFFFESRHLNARFLNQFSHQKWMEVTNQFTQLLTDSLLQAALEKLPKESYTLRHDPLLAQMKIRRSNLAGAMSKYYHFLNERADIQTSGKNEFAEITGAPNGGLNVAIYKLSKERNVGQQLFFKTFDPSVTKEVRLFVAKGNDSILLNNKTSNIRLKIIGGDGNKAYNVLNAKRKVSIYEKQANAIFTGKTGKLRKHLSDDSLNTAIVTTNPYNVIFPLINAGYNIDDGVILGFSLKYTRQGFRKFPYGSVQQLSFGHSLSTRAFRFRYDAEWKQALGKADLLVHAAAFAPNNTINFFGRGNETEYIKIGDFRNYYRARFNLYEVDPAIRFRVNKSASISVGPSLRYYRFDSTENKTRYIYNKPVMHSYDSTTLIRSKVHLGLVLNFLHDNRDNKVLPTSGLFLNLKLQGYKGLNTFARSFVQILPEFGMYKRLTKSASIVLEERIGGGLTAGKSAFYQSMFLGGHENLLGYRQYRFAGQHMIYNNLNIRFKLANVRSYLLPGELGLTGFFDIGRVWENNEKSSIFHTGAGGGIYFAPGKLALFKAIAGFSKEGVYPYIQMGVRF